MGDPALGITGQVEKIVVHTAVATLYNNLVTRPTGEAVRSAIEAQLGGGRGCCVSVLDFSQVGVLDFSCADEVIAKLLMKYRRADRPSDAFFVVQDASEHHRDSINTVLRRHKLLLVAVDSGRPALWGPAPGRLRAAWDRLDRMGRVDTAQFASAHGVKEPTAGSWLRRLAQLRVALPDGDGSFASLPAALGVRAAAPANPYLVAAEETAPYELDHPEGDSAAPPAPPPEL